MAVGTAALPRTADAPPAQRSPTRRDHCQINPPAPLLPRPLHFASAAGRHPHGPFVTAPSAHVAFCTTLARPRPHSVPRALPPLQPQRSLPAPPHPPCPLPPAPLRNPPEHRETARRPHPAGPPRNPGDAPSRARTPGDARLRSTPPQNK
ncbi:unnamed protein product [Dicrocoelium dendriticum]|nr:unnamed protein product [Dicrocoelium dendriticum]